MNEYTVAEVEDLMKGFESNNKQSNSSGKALDGKDAINVLINKKL
jgi:hypothetical protein